MPIKSVKKRERVMSPADYLRKHSPIKKGLKIKDEDKPLEKYNKILDHLYLGNYQAAKDKEFFKKKKIRAVLNCSKEDISNHFCSDKKVEYLRIPVDDSLKEVDFKKMHNYMPLIVEFIYKHVVLEKNNILVHCYAKTSGIKSYF